MKKFVIYSIIIFSILSCNNKKNTSVDDSINSKEVVPVEIIKNDTKNVKLVKVEEKSNDKESEFDRMDKLAQKGDKNAILQLYSYSLGKKNKSKILKYEKLGIKYNVEQIIKTKLSDAINKNEYKIAESLIKKLPNKNDKKEFLRILSYNKAIKYSKENKSQLAIKNYITAYNNGMHDLDIHIVNEYLRINDYENALKWLKIADKNGKKEANYQLALIYYKNNLYEKAIKYLKIQYDRGNTELALSIGVCYAKLNNFDEAIKWFKIAKTHGNAEADKFIKEINSYIKGSYIVE